MTNDRDPIQHVIVLALENRSFDHVMGCLQKDNAEIDGIPPASPPRTNTYDGKSYAQAPGAARVIVDDPRHETPHVLIQLKPGDGGPGGFAEDYAASYPMLDESGRGEVMKYHDLGMLPALHALAQNFALCDRWFCSVPGPTWTNRLFMMTGTSLGRVAMPNGIMDLNLHWYDQPTLFDRLDERSKSWAIYHGDVPMSLLLTHQWEPQHAARYRPLEHFFRDVASNDPNDPFPDFAFIEPAYLEPGANDDHPPHDVLAGEALVATLYNAIRANEDLWNKCLLVMLFDEHGGFYDHVMPPAAIPPDRHQEEYTFDRLGVRVPALLVSPFLDKSVIHDVFDHTSLLKYLIDKWSLGPLGDRAAAAKTFGAAFLASPRADTPKIIPAMPGTLQPLIVPPRQPLTGHQSALLALSHALETMIPEDPAVVAARSRQIVSGPQSQVDAAVDRVAAFLAHRSATQKA